MKNKKIIAAVVVILVIIVAAAGAVVYLATRGNTPGQTAGITVFGNGPEGGNFRNFRGIQGTIVSVTGSDLILDGGTSGQALVSINDQTSIQKSVSSDQATVLTPGNTVTVRYTNANNIFNATTISRVDPALITVPGNNQPGNGQNFQTNGYGFRSGEVPRNFNGQTGGPAGDNSQRSLVMFGKVDSVADGKLVLTSQDGNTKTTFDISAASYTVTQKGTAADLSSGAKVQVTGNDSGGKIVARMLTLE